jgi:hypothetical protein
VIERLRLDPRNDTTSDLLETSLEDFRTVCHDRLKQSELPAAVHATQATAGDSHSQLYLIYDRQDAEMSRAWSDFLFDQGMEVIRPVFEGDEAEIREEHEESLRQCDAALILYGQASECWLRRKLRELQKSAGMGRTKPKPAAAISLVPPKSAEKESFRTHEAAVISQMDGFTPDPLKPFVSRLRG